MEDVRTLINGRSSLARNRESGREDAKDEAAREAIGLSDNELWESSRWQDGGFCYDRISEY